jgi:hypothetical protein
MRQRLAIIVTILVVIGALALLSSASYVHVERTPDSEFSPDRSTMNSGATGTRALYDFLHETGYRVLRWREPTANLLASGVVRPDTFVIIGRTRRPIEDDEAAALLYWVEQGGRLVIVDRLPDPGLLPESGGWIIKAELTGNEPYGVSADNLEAMTSGVKKLMPAQPTALTNGVESVLPSRFVSVISIKANSRAQSVSEADQVIIGTPSEENWDKPAPVPATEATPEELSAPVVHVAEDNGALLVDFAHGKGRIVLLADPFILANNGISSADNLQLAINVVAGGKGLIAFDEFHQGRSASQNALVAYFAGTPVVAMCGQIALLILVLIWTKGRRFARPLPLPQVDRRSSLEFVASMAELQERARAYDLALENIYARTRRVLARYAGASNATPRGEIARRVSSRSRIKHEELETLMRNCEDVINGAPTNAQSVVQLAQRLRDVEGALGLRMRSRDTRQTTARL